MEKKKKHPLMLVLKIIMLLLTAVYSVTMVCLAGAGLIYNGKSYGSEVTAIGYMLILSGILLTIGAVLSLFRRNLPNILSIPTTASGLGLCLWMLKKLCDHADRAGWSDAHTMLPVSDMYTSRIMPVIAPAAIALLVAVIQLLSYEAKEERRIRKEKKLAKENEKAPSVLD